MLLLYSFHNNYFNLALSLHLVLLAPMHQLMFIAYYPVLSFLLM